jgi:predicted secreted Zn-dependent protease
MQEEEGYSMNASNRTWTIVIVILLLCCCLEAVAVLGIVGVALPAQPTEMIEVVILPPTETATQRAPTPSALPSAPPRAATRTATAAPTFTRVLPPPPTGIVSTSSPGRTQTPTRVAGVPQAVPYNIIVPTPTAPPSVYPIKFDSRLKVVTYNVTGKTTKELSQSLNANTLADPHEPGSRYYARTDWYLATNWYVKPTARGCEVDRADVSVAMTMTLPMLPTTTGIALDVLKRWNTFMSNTITHEVGHVEIGLRGGREYQRELGNYPPASNCNALRAKLEALFDSHYAAIDRANVDFDVKTEHGAKQGAVFP